MVKKVKLLQLWISVPYIKRGKYMQVISDVEYVLFNSNKIFCTEEKEKIAHPIHYTEN
jgi:hypothetical protein